MGHGHWVHLTEHCCMIDPRGSAGADESCLFARLERETIGWPEDSPTRSRSADGLSPPCTPRPPWWSTGGGWVVRCLGCNTSHPWQSVSGGGRDWVVTRPQGDDQNTVFLVVSDGERLVATGISRMHPCVWVRPGRWAHTVGGVQWDGLESLPLGSTITGLPVVDPWANHHRDGGQARSGG